MKFVPKKVFILQNGVYKEITYQELSQNEKYKGKYFLPLYGMLMEVKKEDYLSFYKDRNHQRYLYRTEIDREVLYYDTWTTDECNGEELLIDEKVNVEDEVEKSLLKQKIHEFMKTVSEKDKELIIAIYFQELTEREYAQRKGVYYNAIHDRKKKIIKNFKKFLKKFL